MNNINLNLYRIFSVVAKSKSLVEASTKLYISQPAISNDIKNLEEMLNTKLIHRNSNGIILTRDGEELAKYLDDIFGMLSVAEKTIKQRNDLEHGVVSIGCPSHIVSLFLMNKIERFKLSFPNIKIEIMSASSDELIEKLQSHKLDFVIDTSPKVSIYNNLETRHINSFNMIFISKKRLSIKDVKELEMQNLILPFEYTNTRRKLNKILEQNKVRIKEANMEIDTTELIINAVKRNMGIGYVIENSVKNELDSKELYKVNLGIELPKTDIYLINIKNQLTNADLKFINLYLNNATIT